MTKHLDNAFGLPHLDDLLKEEGVLPARAEEAPPVDTQAIVAGLHRAQKAVDMMDGTDHAKSMDEIFAETLDHARKVADLGYNIDPARAPRMFEVATGLFKVALDAKNSKRDAQLKAMQLMINQQKFELEKQQMTGEQAENTVETKGIVVEDRNELIKRLREQGK